ncbi:MAG: energy transducer TonB [Gammaproteobacteria bacterium]
MNIRLAAGLLLGLLPVVVLTACSSAPRTGDAGDAYWQDQAWDGKLLDSVQSALHYPSDASGQPVQPVPSEARATVGFTYASGKIVDARIIESSGRADLDAAFLAQVMAIDPPSAYGDHAAESHPFELVLEMPTPMQEFEVAEYKALVANREYPQGAILQGSQGSSLVGFTYRDGKAEDIHIIKSSGSKPLDEASLYTVKKAHLPPRPAWMSPKPLDMTITICYSLGNSNICPKDAAMLQISDSP